jgi:hypothetical protein
MPDVNAVPAASKETEEQRLARLEQEKQVIDDGEKLDQFLNHPVVGRVFASLDKQYHGEWLAETDPEKRDLLWAKSKALFDLAKELRATYDRGRIAKHARQTRERNEELRSKRRSRR